MGVAKEEEAVVVAEVVLVDAHPRKSKDAVGEVVGVAPDTRVGEGGPEVRRYRQQRCGRRRQP